MKLLLARSLRITIFGLYLRDIRSPSLTEVRSIQHSMKIICIGRNYAEHIEELGNERPEHPIIFMKPDTALLKNNEPFYYPDFSKEVHHEVELLVKIKKEGKSIQKEFAHQYYDEIGLGIDFTARDWQTLVKEKGYPWEIAKAFNDAIKEGTIGPLQAAQAQDVHPVRRFSRPGRG